MPTQTAAVGFLSPVSGSRAKSSGSEPGVVLAVVLRLRGLPITGLHIFNIYFVDLSPVLRDLPWQYGV